MIIKEPVFLVGAERSGTTLLRLMLSHHPEISFQSEFEFVVDQVPENKGWPPLGKYYEYLSTNRIFQSYKLKIDRNLDYPALMNYFLNQTIKENKHIIGATIHRYYDRILRIWPDARFIYIIRDGRDVARSCVVNGWAGNVWIGADRWMAANKCWEKIRKVVSPERRIELSYENLISNPVETLTSICDFLGTSYNPKMIEYPKTSTYGTPDPHLIFQWKRKLSQHSVQLVESKIADQLIASGYSLSGMPIISINPLMTVYLRVQNWLARLLFRIKRYGVLLVLIETMTRRFRIKKWNKQLLLKMHTIETSYLK